MGRLMCTSVTWSISKLCCALISSSAQWNCWEYEISLTQILECVLHTGTKCPLLLFEDEQTDSDSRWSFLSKGTTMLSSLTCSDKVEKSLLLPQTQWELTRQQHKFTLQVLANRLGVIWYLRWKLSTFYSIIWRNWYKIKATIKLHIDHRLHNDVSGIQIRKPSPKWQRFSLSPSLLPCFKFLTSLSVLGSWPVSVSGALPFLPQEMTKWHSRGPWAILPSELRDSSELLLLQSEALVFSLFLTLLLA